ncbi:unnamed protein product [Closterium sp. Yama58-4]|nr:unnamed protein product [Closterium sp. Yama58-4]
MALDWAKALRQAAKIRSSSHHQWNPDSAAAESSGLSAGGGLSANSLPACPAPWALSPATPSSSTSEGDSAVTVTNGCKPFAAAKKLSVSLSAQASAQGPSPARASSRRGRQVAPMQVPPLASPSTGSCSYGGRGGAVAEAGSPRSASWVDTAVETPRGVSGSPPSFTAVSPLLLPPNAANGAVNGAADLPSRYLSSSRKAAPARRAKRPAAAAAPAATASPSAAEVETALNDWLTNVLAPALAAGGAVSGNAPAPRASLANGPVSSNKPLADFSAGFQLGSSAPASVAPPPPLSASPANMLAEELVGQWRKAQQLPRAPAIPPCTQPAPAVVQATAETPAPFLARPSFPRTSCSAPAPSAFDGPQCNPVASPPPVAQTRNAPAHVPPHAPLLTPAQPLSPPEPVHAPAQPVALPAEHSARGGNDSPEDAFGPLAFLAGDLDECDQVKPQVNLQNAVDAKGKLSGAGGLDGCASLFLFAAHDVRGAEQAGGGKCAEGGESLEELAAQDIDWQSLLAPWEPASGGSSGAPDSEFDAAPGENSGVAAVENNNGSNDCPSATSQVVASGDGDLAPMWHADVADLCMGVPAWISHEDVDGLHQWDSHSYEEEHMHLAKRQRLV